MPKVQITDTILRDASPVSGRHADDAPRRCCPCLRHAGQGRLLFSGVLGRRDLRRLPALPERGSRGSACASCARRLPNTKLQMLLRGQNLLGYRHYADDVVEFFVKKVDRKRHRHHPHASTR